MIGVPGAMRWPTWTWRLVTTPSIGARITVRERSSRAWSSAALAASDVGIGVDRRVGDQRLVGGIILLSRAAVRLGLGDCRLRLAQVRLRCRHRRCGTLVSSSLLTKPGRRRDARGDRGRPWPSRRSTAPRQAGRAAWPMSAVAGADLGGERRRWWPTVCWYWRRALQIGGFGLFEGEPGVAVVEAQKHIAPVDVLGVHHAARLLTAAATSGVTCRALGADIGIVGRDVAGVVEQIPASASNQQCSGEPEHHLAAARVGALPDSGSLSLGRFNLLAFTVQNFLGVAFSHCGILRRNKASGSIDSAAEGADQLHVEGEGTGFELSHREARVDDTFLCGEDAQIDR